MTCKKAAMALILTLSLALSAAAAEAIAYPPAASVEYLYTTETEIGTVRYIAQTPKSAYFYQNYWGAWADAAPHECLTASISMALSYIGVNETPASMLDRGKGVTLHSFPWGGCRYIETGLNDAVLNYLNGGGKYSPPIIHLDNYSAGGHYVLIVGRVSDNVYRVADPYKSALWDITVKDGVATYDNYGPKTDRVTTAMQYHIENGATPANTLVFTIDSSSYIAAGDRRETDAAPYIKNDRTYLPMRFVCEALGADVYWDAAAQTATITKASVTINISIGSLTMTVNGVETRLDTAPEIVNRRTCLPISPLVTALGAGIAWDAALRSVTVAMP